MVDKDGSEGIFSLRIDDDNKNQILVGAQDKFLAVSRKNYIQYNNNNNNNNTSTNITNTN